MKPKSLGTILRHKLITERIFRKLSFERLYQDMGAMNNAASAVAREVKRRSKRKR